MADQPATPLAFDRYLSYFLIFAFTSGTLAHCLPAVLPVTKLTTDGLLFVLNGLVLYAIYRTNQDKRLFLWLAVAYAFTFVMEALGVATGAIFGEYQYGPTMWFQWLGVPFVIALNWCVLTLACNEVAIRILERFFPDALPANQESRIETASGRSEANRESHISATVPPPTPANRISHIFRAATSALSVNQESRIEYRESHISATASSPTAAPPPTPDYPLPTTYYLLLAALLTALYDVIIEPVAIALDYWQWGGGEIPLQNYLAWAAIAFLISLPLYVFKIRFRSPVLLVYFFAQLFFFVVLNFML
ncbi:MAG: hypothetical protein ACI819_000039 [Neolewinella sp.]